MASFRTLSSDGQTSIVPRSFFFRILTFSIALTIAASGQDTLRVTGHLGGWIGPAVVQSNHAFIGQGTSLTVLDLSGPKITQVAAVFLHPGYEVDALAVHGRYAFVGYAGDTLRVLDISTPSGPQDVAFYTIPFLTQLSDIQCDGTRLYLGDRKNGLYICDTTGIATSLKTLGASGVVPVWRFHADGNVVGLLRNTTPYEMQLLNVNNPAAPIKTGSAALPERGNDILVKGNFAYVTTMTGLRVYNITDPQNPQLVTTVSNGAKLWWMTLEGTTLYVRYTDANNKSRLRLYNLSNPAAPVQLGETSDLKGLNAIALAGTTAYLSEGFRFSAFDASNPQAPSFIREFSAPWDPKSVLASGDRLFVGDAEKLFVYDATTPDAPILQYAFDQWQNSARLALADSTLIALDDSYNQSKLSFIDITNQAAPVHLSTYTPPQNMQVQELSVKGNVAYLGVRSNTTKAGWLYVLDVSNPSAPKKIAELALPAQPKDLVLPDSASFLIIPYHKDATSRGFVIVDITNPSAPSLVADRPMNVNPAAAWVEQDTLFIVANQTTSTWELSVFDISNRANPQQMTSTVGNGQAWDVQYHQGRIYASLPGGSIHVFSLVPTMWKPVETYRKDIHSPGNMTIHDGGSSSSMYITTGYTGYEEKGITGSGGIDIFWWWPLGKQAILTLAGAGYPSAVCSGDTSRKVRTFGFSLTADLISDWDLQSIKLLASGNGNDQTDVKMVRLYQGGQKLSEGKFNSDDGFVGLAINKQLAAGKSMQFMVEYELMDSIALPAGPKTFSFMTSMFYVGATATSWPFSKKLPPNPFFGGPLNVTSVYNSNTGEWYATIQSAINDSRTRDGDTIVVCPGTFNENVTVTKSLTIKSRRGRDVTIVTANSRQDDVFTILKKDVTIDGFTIRGADGTDVAGVYIMPSADGYVYVKHTSITGNDFGITDLRPDSLHNLFLNDCKITSNREDGVESRSNVTAYGVDVANNGGWGFVVGGDLLVGSPLKPESNTVQRNGKGGIFTNARFSGANIDVTDNGGPGIAARGGIELMTAQVNDNAGPGLFSLEGPIKINGGDATQNKVCRNKGAGIWCKAFGIDVHQVKGPARTHSSSGPAGVEIQKAIIINDNASWGIIASGEVGLNIINRLPTEDKRPSEVQRNGLASEFFEITEWSPDGVTVKKKAARVTPATGGGICSMHGDVYAMLVDAIGNGGPGIYSGQSAELTVVKANNNNGTGICAIGGGVTIYPTRYDRNELCEVSGNRGSGIQSKRHVAIALSIQIRNNASWGIKAGSYVDLNFFDDRATPDFRTSMVTGNGTAPTFLDCAEHIPTSDYPYVAQVTARPGLIDGGGIWSKRLSIWAREIDVSNNGGPGLMAYSHLYVRGIYANNNNGHGLYSRTGSVTIDLSKSAASDENQVNGNRGCGIASNGIGGSAQNSAGVNTSISVQIKDNAAWGIRSLSHVELNRFAGTATLDQRTSVISGNGHAPTFEEIVDWDEVAPERATITRNPNFADGGGVWSWRGSVVGHYLDVNGNNGPGIAAQSDISVRGIAVNNNDGPGIYSQYGGVRTDPIGKPGYALDQVKNNRGYGIWAGGVGRNKDIFLNSSGVFLSHPIVIANNGGWGVGAIDDVQIGYYFETPLADTRTSRVEENGKQPFWYDVEWDPESFNSVMDRSTVLFRPKSCGGINTKSHGVRLLRTSISNNGSDGIRAAKEVNVQLFQIRSNAENGIRTSGAVRAHSGAIALNDGWGIIASSVDSLPLVTIEKNVAGGIYLRQGTKLRPDADTINIIDRRSPFEKSNQQSTAAAPSLTSFQIADNDGDGLLDDVGSGAAMHDANIFANGSYGVRNRTTQTIDASNCWWGANDGPSGAGAGTGDEVSVNVAFAPWRAKRNILSLAAMRDTIFLSRGAVDSVFAIARRFDGDVQVTDFTISDSLGWLVGSATIRINPTDASTASVSHAVRAPQQIAEGTVNKIRVHAALQNDPTITADATIVCRSFTPSVARVSIHPDTVTLRTGDRFRFNAKAFDQRRALCPLIEEWSSNGGTFDSTGLFIAGKNAGLFSVTVRDSVTRASASAVVRIEAPRLMKVSMVERFIQRTSDSAFVVYAVGSDQFQNVIPFAAQWSVARGVIDSTFTLVDSAASISIAAAVVSHPADTAAYRVIVRDQSSGLADTALVYFAALKRIAILPDTMIVQPNTESWFSARGYDQLNNAAWFFPAWSATGGTIDSTGRFTAGNTEGIFVATAKDRYSSIQARAVLLIQKPRLLSLSFERDTMFVRPKSVTVLTAHAIDQFGAAFSIAPQWTTTGGTLSGQSSSVDSLLGFVMHATYTAPASIGSFSVIVKDAASGKSDTLIVIVRGAVRVVTPRVPTDCILAQNYPNPFSERTQIEFKLATPGHVSLRVYDLLGRQVAVIVNEWYDAGWHSTTFRAQRLPSGVYFYRLVTNSATISAKAVIRR